MENDESNVNWCGEASRMDLGNFEEGWKSRKTNIPHPEFFSSTTIISLASFWFGHNKIPPQHTGMWWTAGRLVFFSHWSEAMEVWHYPPVCNLRAISLFTFSVLSLELSNLWLFQSVIFSSAIDPLYKISFLPGLFHPSKWDLEKEKKSMLMKARLHTHTNPS